MSTLRTLAFALGLSLALASTSAGQTRTLPWTSPAGSATQGRPVPGPVYEIPGFSRAVDKGTRTRTGKPGASNWVQHARYTIAARLDVPANRISGTEHVVYLNNAPDSLPQIMVHLRQNVFTPEAQRREATQITGGVTLDRVAVAGNTITAPAARGGRGGGTGAQQAARYAVNGAIMTITLATPLRSRDSVALDFAWSYSPPVTPADGREGRDDHLYLAGYWYPQIAVYDDVNGWVADPYQLEAEFYMDPADYDVAVTVPRGWPVGATGTLVNADSLLTAATRAKLAQARTSPTVVNIVRPGPDAINAFVPGGADATWHFRANDVRDFAWGTSDRYAWDATRALVPRVSGTGRDTVAIESFYRLTTQAAAWEKGGARFTRDAIEQLSAYLWRYPWPKMTSMEGVLTGGGMEYPMMTFMQPWSDTLSLAGDLMHETGHMWFPMQVGASETRYPWMDEGFTQFDAAQGMRVLYGEPRTGGRTNDSEQGQRRAYTTRARAGDDQSLMQNGDLFPSALYNTMYYQKTAQVLAALRGLVGDSVFHAAFRAYGQAWIGRHPYPWDFFNAMQTGIGRDLSWFWNTWFFEGWPLDQAIASVTTAGDSVAITVEDRGLAPMPARLTITRASGPAEQVEIPVTAWLSGARAATVKVRRLPEISTVVINAAEQFPDLDRTNQTWKR